MKEAIQFQQMTYYVECPYCGHTHADDTPWFDPDEGDSEEKIDCAKCGEYFMVVREAGA